MSGLAEIKNTLEKVAAGSLSSQSLEDVAGLNLSAAEEQDILSYVKSRQILSNLQKKYALFEQEKEVVMVEKLLANPEANWKTLYPLPEKYLPLVREEVEKLALVASDHLAITGSGSFPATAITFADYTEANITCIEKIPQYAELSKKILQELGYNRIKVVCADAKGLNYEPYSAVLITLLTSNKNQVLQQIHKTSHARVLLRSVKGVLKLIYPETTETDLKPFKASVVLANGYIIAAK